MALINCPECGKQVSDSAEKCIHCGYPISGNPKSPKKSIFFIVGIILLVVVLIVMIAVWGKVQDSHNAAKSSTVGDLSTSAVAEGFSEDKTTSIIITKGSMQTTSTCEFELTGYTIADRIEPENCTESYYHYFKASAGNVYVDVKFKIKNLQNNAIQQDSVLKRVKLIYDDTYEYDCSFVTVDKNGDFQNFTNLYDINPLTTLEYHMLSEVPSEVKNSGKRLVCQIEVDGSVYKCRLR